MGFVLDIVSILCSERFLVVGRDVHDLEEMESSGYPPSHTRMRPIRAAPLS